MRKHPTSAGLSLHGAFWTRLLHRILRVAPPWFCVAVAQPLALIFYAAARAQRQALRGNLGHLLPHRGRLYVWWAGYRVFVNFALTYMDRLWSLHLGAEVRWEFRNLEEVRESLARPGGVLLLTVHSGNYDLGAGLFIREFPRNFHMVRTRERSPELQEVRHRELERTGANHARLRVHYGLDEWSLGVELSRQLAAGEVVAVQGDRAALPGQSMKIRNGRYGFLLPRGPFLLAAAARVPCFPVFMTRLGRCHYRLESGAALLDGSGSGDPERVARAWLEVMVPFLERNWDQWFVFERVMTSPGTAAEPESSP